MYSISLLLNPRMSQLIRNYALLLRVSLRLIDRIRLRFHLHKLCKLQRFGCLIDDSFLICSQIQLIRLVTQRR